MFGQKVRYARDEGFTLTELLIVIFVLGILASIVVFGVSTFTGDAKVSACKAEVKTVAVASDAYAAKNGRPADSIEALVKERYLKSMPADRDYTVIYWADSGDVAAKGLDGCP